MEHKLLFLVTMKDEFEGGTAWWCHDCVERDSDMLFDVPDTYNFD
jgi:hypothetical protein